MIDMKLCKKYKKLLALYVLDELSDTERKELEDHIESCPICPADLEEEKVLITKLAQTRRPEPNDDLLTQCRTELRYRLRAERRKRETAWWQRTAEALNPFTSLRLALAGPVVMLFIGIVIGHFLYPIRPTPPNAEIASGTEVERIMHVRSLRFDPVTNQVEVEFSTVKDVFLRGDMDDELIRKALVYSLQNQDTPGMRIRAVNALSATPVRGDEIEAALIYALENDENSGVRLKAAKVLRNMPLNELIKKAFIRILLSDTNSAVRIEAVDALSRVKGESVKPIMQRASRRDENEYVRLKASRSLERLEQNPKE